jgi:phosphoenolpyruvate carboxykinase (ATP)
VNTGWTGGPYGIGSRMRIVHTRAMICAALGGELDHAAYGRDAVFNLEVPRSCPDVPSEVLTPRNTWKNPMDYDAQAQKLARMFVDNFKSFEGEASADIKAAGPHAV